MTAAAIDLSGAPASGRRSTILEALTLLHERFLVAHIVEVGTSRNTNEAACASDGWATRLFAWYAAQTGSSVTTIDTRATALKRAEQVCGPWKDRVVLVEGRGDEVVSKLWPIDLLYLDGPPEPETHLDIYRALSHKPPLVLFDDITDRETFAVKGELAIPAMLEDGYDLIFCRDRQALLEWSS